MSTLVVNVIKAIVELVLAIFASKSSGCGSCSAS